MALGASQRNILTMVLGSGTKLAALGIVIGGAGALVLMRLMKSFLFGVSPSDPLTFTVIALTLAGVALLATFVPARRAMRVDPNTALRYE
jgi:ABC-type antimicrobial peptide transport system permease subunit